MRFEWRQTKTLIISKRCEDLLCREHVEREWSEVWIGKLEVAAGLEPAKIGFADRRLDHFGIATLAIKIASKTCRGFAQGQTNPT